MNCADNESRSPSRPRTLIGSTRSSKDSDLSTVSMQITGSSTDVGNALADSACAVGSGVDNTLSSKAVVGTECAGSTGEDAVTLPGIAHTGSANNTPASLAVVGTEHAEDSSADALLSPGRERTGSTSTDTVALIGTSLAGSAASVPGPNPRSELTKSQRSHHVVHLCSSTHSIIVFGQFLTLTKNVSLCNDQCWAGPAGLVSICGKKVFNILIFLDTIDVIKVKLCIMVVLIELYPFMPLSMSLIVFPGYSSHTHDTVKKKKIHIYIYIYPIQLKLCTAAGHVK